MARAPDLEAAIERALVGLEGVRFVNMFGGRCYMLNGNMVGGAREDKDGVRRFMLRVGKERADLAEAICPCEPMMLGNKPMLGFYFIVAENCDEVQLREWLALAIEHAKSLRPKVK
jgi:TfoX N-terminal domain